MDRVLEFVLRSFIRHGTLRLTTASGDVLQLGDGTGEPIAVRFTSWKAELAVLLDPELAVGESYIDGRLLVEQGSLAEFLELAVSNVARLPPNRWMRLVEWLRSMARRVLRLNTKWRAKQNASHHYDIDRRIYELFLDKDMQYSCAYFESDDENLEEAQAAKRRHIASKLHLNKPNLAILDIGSGWGGLAFHLAQHHRAAVVGINLSEEQIDKSQQRAADMRLTEKVQFRLQDYRDLSERFDRIVSVGMFEHVGKEFYREFFGTCRRLLKDDGVMLLHTVGRLDGPSETNPWVQKYIFPGGYAPALSEIAAAIEGSGLLMTDVEILRLHYARTLRAWRRNFDARRGDVRRIFAADPELTERFGGADRFIRMWDFYLAGFEQFFKYYRLVVFQVQLTKLIDAVPLTRRYIYDPLHSNSAARSLRAAE